LQGASTRTSQQLAEERQAREALEEAVQTLSAQFEAQNRPDPNAVVSQWRDQYEEDPFSTTLSLAQAVTLSGAVVVTQPPRVAAAEAHKAAAMFRALNVPVLGIVENMSGPFGHGSGAAVAADLGVPFLGDVPFDEAIVAEGDAGMPTMSVRPNSASGAAFDSVSAGIARALGWQRVAAEP